MADQTVGKGWIEVAVKGLEKVQSTFNGMRAGLGRAVSSVGFLNTAIKKVGDVAKATAAQIAALGASMEAVGNKAKIGFAVATASMFGFAKAADPYAFMQLQGTLAEISVQIGSIFIPVLDAANKQLKVLLDWLRGLTNEQKDNILKWTLMGTAVLGVVALIPKFIALVRLAAGAMAVFGAVTGFATGGISTLLGAIAALVGGFVAYEVATGKAGQLTEIFGKVVAALQPVVESAKKVFEVLQVAVGKAIEAIVPVVTKLAEVFAGLIGSVVPVVVRIAEVFGQIVAVVVPVVAKMAETVGRLLGNLASTLISVVLPVVEQFATLFMELWKALAPVIEAGVALWTGQIELLLAVVGAVLPVVTTIIKVAMTVIIGVVKALAPVIEVVSKVITVFATALSVFADVIAKVAAEVAPIIEELGALFTGLAEVVGSVLTTAVELLTVPLQLVGELLLAALEAIRPMIPLIVRLAQVFRDVLVPVIRGVRDTFAALVTFMFDSINNVIRVVNGLIDKINKLPGIKLNRISYVAAPTFGAAPDAPRAPDHRPQPDEAGRGGGGGQGGWMQLAENIAKGVGRAVEDGNRHAPRVAQNVQIGGLVDAWKRAQEAVRAMTPEERARQEQLRLQLKTVEGQQEMIDLLKRLYGKNGNAIGP